MGDDYSQHLYGDLSIEPKNEKSGRVWENIKDINEDFAGKEVLIRGRIHNSRVKGNLAFLVIRDNFYTIQSVASKNEIISKHMIKFIAGISNESIVEVQAYVIKPEIAVESCSQKVEL